MDPVQKLPPEITAEIFSYLDHATLLMASLTSRAWRNRILDSRLWRELYIQEGWDLNIKALRQFEQQNSRPGVSQHRKSRSRQADSDIAEPKLKKRVPPSGFSTQNLESQSGHSPSVWNEQHDSVEADDPGSPHDAEGDREMQDVDEPSNRDSPHRSSSSSVQHNPPRVRGGGLSSNSIRKQMFQSGPPQTSGKSALLSRLPDGTAKINWMHLYKQRRRLEENWIKGRFINFQLPHPAHLEEAHQECVYAIQFSGRWLVSGSRDKTVRVWNMETKRLSHRPLVGHTKSVLCLQFDPDPSEDIIISGSGDQSIIVWRFSTGDMIQRLPSAHDDSVLNLRFDKRYLVTCSKDKLIKVWNRQELIATDKDYPSVTRGVGVKYASYIIDRTDFPPALLEAEIANRYIKPLAPYSLLMTLDGHGAAVNAIQINDHEIVSASGDRLIKVWNIHNGECIKTLMGHQKGIACVQCDNRRIVSGSNDDTVRVYDYVSGAEVACLPDHHDLVRTVQANFGDPPGAEETLKLEALAVDSEYWDARRSGSVTQPVRKRSVPVQNTGSRNPKDIMALGASLPPGGGGSRWGRILSGSYDGTIIIWRKDREGKWIVGHRLRQEDAVINAASSNRGQQARIANRVNGPFPPATPQVPMMNGQPIAQANPGPSAMLHSTPNSTAASGHSTPQSLNNTGNDGQQQQQHQHQHQYQQQQHLQQQQQAPTWANSNTNPPAQQGNLQTGATASNQLHSQTGPAPHHFPPLNQIQAMQAQAQQYLNRAFANPGLQPSSRVFKLQFDARKVICASQDPRIVGWDFACGDEDLLEACQFFTEI